MSKVTKKYTKLTGLLLNSLFFAIFVAVASIMPNVFKKGGSVVKADLPYAQSNYYGQSGYGSDGSGHDGRCDSTPGGSPDCDVN